MLAYLFRRLLIAVPTLLGITVLTFAFVNLAPGDPLMSMLGTLQGGRGGVISPEVLTSLRTRYGLDQPGPVRYAFWLGQLAQGNFGQRYSDRRDIADVIFGERLLPTLELMGAALALAIPLGIGLGVISALRHYGRLDYLLTVTAFVGISLPEFFAGILLIYFLAVRLRLLPTSGMETAGSSFSWGDNLQHLVMPAVVLSLGQLSELMRYARSSVLDVINLDYVRTARAKGLKEGRVILAHVFRNALLPLITVVGTMMPKLIAGSAIVESVFQWPGMGLLYLQSVQNRDYATIMALVLLTSVMVLLSNLLADLAYAFADPRIRYS
jgi:peptide/nickel transport system permease protein